VQNQVITVMVRGWVVGGCCVILRKSNFTFIYMGNISQYDSGERCGSWASCFGILIMFDTLLHVIQLMDVLICKCRTNTIPILMHQMRISTNQVSSVVNIGFNESTDRQHRT
jgi:hypothetical protein